MGVAARPLYYLDHWALSDISNDSVLRERVLRISRYGTLLFSMFNLVETGRLHGPKLENIISFLEAIGPRWAPISPDRALIWRRERAGELDPWRDEQVFPHWLRAPQVDGKLPHLVRRFQEPWAAEAFKTWERREIADIRSYLSVAHERVRKGKLKLDGTSDVPFVLDSKGVFDTVIQRVVRRDVKLDRNQIEDVLHAIHSVPHADVVFLDWRTKKLIERMRTRAKVFSRTELEDGLRELESMVATVEQGSAAR